MPSKNTSCLILFLQIIPHESYEKSILLIFKISFDFLIKIITKTEASIKNSSYLQRKK